MYSHSDIGPKTILIVDDEATIREAVRRYLEHDGFKVREVVDGDAALAAVQEDPPDLILLDWMLPGMDGLMVMRQLRHNHKRIPIVMLSARSETSDRILGLDLGADDYIPKPFSPQEVVSRVRAVLRRSSEEQATVPQPADPIEINGLRLEPATRIVMLDGKPLSLTVREFDFLWFLASHPNQVFTRDQILDLVWGHDFYGDPATVTVHIRRLRQKIEADAANPRFIVTVWGVGYRFQGKDI